MSSAMHGNCFTVCAGIPSFLYTTTIVIAITAMKCGKYSYTRGMYTQESIYSSLGRTLLAMHVYNTDKLMGTEYSQSWFTLAHCFMSLDKYIIFGIVISLVSRCGGGGGERVPGTHCLRMRLVAVVCMCMYIYW